MNKFLKTPGKKQTIFDIFLRVDDLTSALIYARYSEYIQEKTSIRMKDCSSQHFLGWKFFIDESLFGNWDERFFICTGICLRPSVRQSIESGKVEAIN